MKEKVTNDIIKRCLLFIHEQGGEVSRYSFDRFITKNIRINESFNLIPMKLDEEGLISITRQGQEIRIILTSAGANRLLD
ncbi:hypothetical protein [Fulvivirga lutimaris]|uniref:hypothetical protein n=1 Tax=Fulvivirga lutimaris TaxID=1819566 RepID=UPI0012BBF11B|nr:hypothetical protein [Fulvivirga lutimaris]MTI41585.1 hypothetical protein [Fulvivirga lutimaris]